MVDVAVQAHPLAYAALVIAVRDRLGVRLDRVRFRCVARPSMASTCSIYIVVSDRLLTDAERVEIVRQTEAFQVIDVVWDAAPPEAFAERVVAVIEKLC